MLKRNDLSVFLLFYFPHLPDFTQIKKTTCHESFLNQIAFNLVLSCRGFDFVKKKNKKKTEHNKKDQNWLQAMDLFSGE